MMRTIGVGIATGSACLFGQLGMLNPWSWVAFLVMLAGCVVVGAAE